jgi:hypothetical protein
MLAWRYEELREACNLPVSEISWWACTVELKYIKIIDWIYCVVWWKIIAIYLDSHPKLIAHLIICWSMIQSAP